ncbi:MAG TPA: DinB family protein [Gemmatimonadaceae bacterium]
MRRAALIPLLLMPVVATAQVPDLKLVAEDFDRSRQAVMNYLDAAPDSMLTYRPTPGVRTFAEQIDHLSLSAVFIGGFALTGERPGPEFIGDTARTLHDKAALREIVNKRLEHLVGLIRAANPQQLVDEVEIIRGVRRPKWNYLQLALTHNAWHLAQTVPYLRLNGVTPPAYLAF